MGRKKSTSTEVNTSIEQPEDPEIAAFQRHQANVPRPSLAEDTRTIVATSGLGVLSTVGRGDTEGFPVGSVVSYVADEDGRLIFSFSSLSAHTGDLLKDPKCSVTIMANGFAGLADARISIAGKMSQIPSDDIKQSRELYLKKHPDSFWVDFGDFSWFRLDSIVKIRVVGGFGRAGSVNSDQYYSAQQDPVAMFSSPVCTHMNDDHSEASIAMVKHYAGITVDKATMLSLDKLGINLSCDRNGDTFRCRLPYPNGPVTERKAIKDAIVEMTKSAMASQKET